MEPHEITVAYQYLIESTKDYAANSEHVIETKAELDKNIAMAYANGSVQGKNQSERDGWIAQNFEKQTKALEVAQSDERKAKLQLDIARIEVEKVRALLRLEELKTVFHGE